MTLTSIGLSKVGVWHLAWLSSLPSYLPTSPFFLPPFLSLYPPSLPTCLSSLAPFLPLSHGLWLPTSPLLTSLHPPRLPPCLSPLPPCLPAHLASECRPDVWSLAPSMSHRWGSVLKYQPHIVSVWCVCLSLHLGT